MKRLETGRRMKLKYLVVGVLLTGALMTSMGQATDFSSSFRAESVDALQEVEYNPPKALVLLSELDLSTETALKTLYHFDLDVHGVILESSDEIGTIIDVESAPNIIFIGHGTSEGVKIAQSDFISWDHLADLVNSFKGAERQFYFMSCYSDGITPYISPKIRIFTFTGEVDAIAAGVDVAAEIYADQRRQIGWDSVVSPYESFVQDALQSPFYQKTKAQPSLLLSQLTTARTKLTAAVMVDDSQWWFDLNWIDPGTEEVIFGNVKSDIERWVQDLDTTFGIQITVEYVSKFILDPNKVKGAQFTISGRPYTANDNLQASLFQAMQAFPGEWDPGPKSQYYPYNPIWPTDPNYGNPLNKYDILIVYVYDWNGGHNQAFQNSVVLGFSHPWPERQLLCHELSHVFGDYPNSDHPNLDSIEILGIPFVQYSSIRVPPHGDPHPSLPPGTDWYNEYPQYYQPKSIMDYYDMTDYFWLLGGLPASTWDSHNYNVIWNHREMFAEKDPDNDGLKNWEEWGLGTLTYEADSDGDGLTDGEEILGLNPKHYYSDPLKQHSDGDGLTDYAEVKTHGTNPLLPDTDWDGFNDPTELLHGWNPLVWLSPGRITIGSQPSSTSSKSHSFWVYTPDTNRLKVYKNGQYAKTWIKPETSSWLQITVNLNYQASNTIRVEAYHVTTDGIWSPRVNSVQFTIYCSYSPPPPGGGGGGYLP